MSEILSEREAEEWWRWMVRVGAQESNSLRRSYEALAARLAEVEAERDKLGALYRKADAGRRTESRRLAEVEQALRAIRRGMLDAGVEGREPTYEELCEWDETVSEALAVLDKGEQN